MEQTNRFVSKDLTSMKPVDLNVSPSNINRPKINNLSSRLLLEGKGIAFVPKSKSECFPFVPSLDLNQESTNVFLDENHKFKSEYNAKELPVLDEDMDEVFSVENLRYPMGSISLTKDFDDTIITSNLWQCAALAIVNKKENVQTLLHFCPTIMKKNNDALLDYLLKFGNEEDLEFTIVPGSDAITDNTMGVLVDRIKTKYPNKNINFKYFPEESEKVLALKNGELYSVSSENISNEIKNPEQEICYATIPNDIF